MHLFSHLPLLDVPVLSPSVPSGNRRHFLCMGCARLYFYYPLVSGAVLFQNGISVPEKVQPGPDCLMGPRYAEFVQFMLHNVIFYLKVGK